MGIKHSEIRGLSATKAERKSSVFLTSFGPIIPVVIGVGSSFDDPRETVTAMTINGAILDLDGTVYRGDGLLSGADDAISTLRERDVSVLFVSNKPIERRERYVEKLNRLGVPCEPTHVSLPRR